MYVKANPITLAILMPLRSFYLCCRLRVLELSVQSQKGVLKALLVTEEGTVAASSLQDDDIDQLGVLANLQALTGLCADVSKYIIVLTYLSRDVDNLFNDIFYY